ncbi:MAG TPA: hypothetical protein VK829_12675 [Terriglobales bacterium]|nr:hypothetical protein [Terriglobales bacterium]
MAYNYSIIVALIAAGLLAVSISLLRILKRTLTDLHLEFQQQIDALSAKVGILERNPIAQSAASVSTLSGKVASQAADEAEPCAAQVPEEITAETLVKIADTVTALLGKKVRIRSVRIVQQQNVIVNPWAQQGRIVIQASHNLAQRGRES